MPCEENDILEAADLDIEDDEDEDDDVDDDDDDDDNALSDSEFEESFGNSS